MFSNNHINESLWNIVTLATVSSCVGRAVSGCLRTLCQNIFQYLFQEHVLVGQQGRQDCGHKVTVLQQVFGD